MRQLEQENNRLTVQIKDIEIVEKKEKNNMAERFEAEKVRDEGRMLWRSMSGDNSCVMEGNPFSK